VDPAGVPDIAPGERVVEEEVAEDGEPDREHPGYDLVGVEVLGEHDEGNHVDQYAGGPDEGELPEAPCRRHVPEQAQYVSQVLEALAHGRLGYPGMASLELERRLEYLEFGCAHEYLEQHLEPRRPELDA
jgi:hypothetical protein